MFLEKAVDLSRWRLIQSLNQSAIYARWILRIKWPLWPEEAGDFPLLQERKSFEFQMSARIKVSSSGLLALLSSSA
jgi:hypothetical protein